MIHAAAALAADGADDADITKRIDEAWHHLDFGSAWYSAKQREQAERMVRKFLDWHRANPRQLAAVEKDLHVSVGQVEITGRVDRLERDADGSAIVVDLKTGSSRPADDELDRNPQLGVYQLAVLLGAFEELGLTQPGGAELVQVGKAGLTARARVQRQRSLAGRPGARLGTGPGGDRGHRDGRFGVHREGESRLPGVPGRRLLPGARARRAGVPVTAGTGGAQRPSTTPFTPAQLARLLGVAEPTQEQAAVIGAPLGPLAVIAGAGSGKSETMAARLVWLVANGLVRPERVLGLTFTRKAAAELADRVRGRLDGLRRAGIGLPGVAGAGASDDRLQGDPVIATYHAYAGRLVGDHALREAVEPSIRLITPAVAWQLAARVVAAYDGPMDAIAWTPSTVTAAVLDLSAELAEHLRGPADVLGVGEWLAGRCDEILGSGRGGRFRGVISPGQQGGGFRGVVPPGQHGRVPAPVQKILDCQRVREQMLPLVAAFQAAKAAREVMDYGDQMALAARIAERHPEVGAAERARYQVVLLDEYQDTSHAQLVLLRALFGGGHPVTAVGDPCQSIYGWRGASAGNLRRFGTDFPARGGAPAPTALLSTSFRNTGRVLDAAAAVQEGLRAAAPEVPRLVAPPPRAGRGTVVCALLETAAEEVGLDREPDRGAGHAPAGCRAGRRALAGRAA